MSCNFKETIFLPLLCFLALFAHLAQAQTVIPGFPQVNDAAGPVISDGNKGWFVGGAFTTANGITHNHIIHIKSDYSLDANFNTSLDGVVRTMALVGNRLFINGYFTTVAGSSIAAPIARSGFAAIDLTPGVGYGYPIASWGVNTFISGLTSAGSGVYLYVMTPSSDGTQLYIGGSFHQCNGVNRSNIASIYTSDGSLNMTWDPSATGVGVNEETSFIDESVRAIIQDGTTIYVGGTFQNIGGQHKQGIADVNTTNGQIISGSLFNPQASGTLPGGFVNNILLDGNNLYVDGAFLSISGQPRNKLALINKITGQVDSTFFASRTLVGYAYNFQKTSSTLYLGGSIVQIDGNYITTVGSVDAVTGSFNQCWQPNLTELNFSNLYVSGMLLVGDSAMIVTGRYTHICGVDKSYLQLITLTGKPRIDTIPTIACNTLTNTTVDVTLKGFDFFSPSTLTFNGIPVTTFTNPDIETLVATFPTSSLSSGTFTVTNSCGTASKFFVAPNVIIPTISNVSAPPSCLYAPDSVVNLTLTGTKLDSVQLVVFNGSYIPFTSIGSTSLKLTIPAYAAGTAYIYLYTACGNATTPTPVTIPPQLGSVAVTNPGTACLSTDFTIQATAPYFTTLQASLRGQPIGSAVTSYGYPIYFTVPAAQLKTGLDTLVIQESYGTCSKDYSSTFTVTASPGAAITLAPVQACGATSAPITFHFTGPAPWQVTYTDGTSFFTDSFSVSPALRQRPITTTDTSLTYTLLGVTTLVNGLPTCSGTIGAPATTILRPGPPKISLTGGINPAFVCASNPGPTFAAQLAGINFYSGTILTYRGLPITAKFQDRTTASFTLPVSPSGVNYVVVSNSCGKDSVPFVSVATPAAALSVADIQPCDALNAELTLKLSGTGPWQVSLSDGASVTTKTYYGSPAQVPVNAPLSAGAVTYTLQNISTLVDGVIACSGTVGSPVKTTFEVSPSALFTTDPAYTRQLFAPNGTVQFIDGSTKAAHYLWDFGDGNTSTSAGNQTHTYTTKGNYTPKLTLWNADSTCVNQYSLPPFDVLDSEYINIPNVYTPNGDGVNDEYYITASDITRFQIFIYDRWGALTWDSPLLHTGWRGQNKNGGSCPVGVYVYTLKATFGSGKEINRSGSITLLR